MKIIEAYWTIYYGFKRYRFNSRPPVLDRRKVSRKLGIPPKNIGIGISGGDANREMWTHPKPNRFLLWIGRVMLDTELARVAAVRMNPPPES